MFGTAVADLDTAVDHLAAMVDAVAAGDVSRADACTGLLGLESARERLEATIGRLLTELDASGAHAPDGAPSMATWLSSRTGQRRATAGSRLWLGRNLRSMPATAAALAAGTITADHARVLSRALTPRTTEAFGRDEAMLVATAEQVTADQLAQVVEFWLRHHDTNGAAPDPEHRDRFWLSLSLDGRLKGNFDLGGDLAITVKMVLDEITAQQYRRDQANRDVDPSDPGLGQTTSQRRARALGELCERAAASPRNPAKRQPLLTLHTTVDTLAGRGDPADWKLQIEQAWASVIPADAASLWSCDCWVSQIVIRATDGEPLDAGRELRTANRAMRRALVARDGARCAVPGCDRHVGWCDVHHILWWEHGGHTRLDNLVFLCRWHHTRVHAGDLVAEVVDGRPRFVTRDGRVLHEPRAGPDPPS